MSRRRDQDLLRTLGRRVALARGARGWTQERLAEAIGIEPVSLSRWETGHRALSLSTLHLIAQALGLGLGELLGAEQTLPTPTLSPQETALLREFALLSEGRRDLLLKLARELAEHHTPD